MSAVRHHERSCSNAWLRDKYRDRSHGAPACCCWSLWSLSAAARERSRGLETLDIIGPTRIRRFWRVIRAPAIEARATLERALENYCSVTGADHPRMQEVLRSGERRDRAYLL